MDADPFSTSLQAYFRDVRKTDILTAEEEQSLSHLIQLGDAAARDHLVRANLRLVIKIARAHRRSNSQLDDLIAEGNLGLIRAAEAFDPDRGIRFSTYASYWIRQSVKRHIINTSRPIRVPAYMNNQVVKWEQAKRKLQIEFDRIPTIEEIAKVLGIPPRKLKLIEKAIRIYSSPSNTGHFGEASAVDTTVAKDEPRDLENSLIQREALDEVLDQLKLLDKREARVLRLRFGLNDDEPRKLSDIGELLGLTRERVRQIEKAALLHLGAKMTQ